MAIFLIIPGCYWLSSPALRAQRLDKALWLYLAAELTVVAILGRMSTGAWVNYGVQAVVFAGVLTGRALQRACDNVPSPRSSVLIALAAIVALIGVTGNARVTARRRQVVSIALRQVFDHIGHPTSEYFFAARPGDNRVYGVPGLAYDDWLYPVFESMHLAEPRSIWLRRALTSPSIRFIVNTSDSPSLDGLGETIPDLGYIKRIQVGPFFVWERLGPPPRPGRR
jgi:hypothetical protein